MKTIQKIFCYLVFAFLLIGTSNAHEVSFSDFSYGTSLHTESTVQQKSNITKLFVIDSQTELVISTITVDGYSNPTNQQKLILNSLLNRSKQLCLTDRNHLSLFDYLFLKNSFKKALIFPFHTFW
nr:hypothetical protein [Nonlabens ulvanivorans]